MTPSAGFDDFSPMKRHHKILLGVGVVLLLTGWLAWSVLLTENEEPPRVEQAN